MRLAATRLRAVAYAARDAFVGPRRGFRVELRDVEGRVGVGEALPLPAAGTETLAECRASLGAALELLGSPGVADFEDVRDVYETIAVDLRSTPAAAFAIDAAAHALVASGRGGALALGTQPRGRVRVNAVLSPSARASLEAAERLARHDGFATLKLKLGRGGLEEHAAWLRALRGRVGPELRLRIDPNGAWSADEALRRLERLAEFDLEFCEQPVAPGDLDGLRRVAAASPVAIAADEALANAEARGELAAGRLTPLGILKPMVLGGLTPAADLARRAREHGTRCVVTTTFEGPPGCAAAAHLAASWGDEWLAHGIAGPAQLEADFPCWLVPQRGEICLPGAREHATRDAVRASSSRSDP